MLAILPLSGTNTLIEKFRAEILEASSLLGCYATPQLVFTDISKSRNTATYRLKQSRVNQSKNNLTGCP